MTEVGGEGPMETTTAAVAAAAAGKKMPLPSSMLWVQHLRNYVGSGEGLGSEAQTEMETKKLLLEAYRARQQQTMAAGGIPSFYKKKPSEGSVGAKVHRLAKFRFLKVSNLHFFCSLKRAKKDNLNDLQQMKKDHI
jgi:hypothetical protein